MAAKSKQAPQRARRQLNSNDVRVIVQEVLDDLGVVKSKADLQSIASAAAKEAVAETLMSLGVDVKNPIATQQMFTGLREVVETFSDKKFQADMTHLRTWRLTMDSVKAKSMLTFVGLVITATAIAMWPRLKMGVE